MAERINFPTRWAGSWSTEDGRTVIIERNPLRVTVLSQPDGTPFRTVTHRRSLPVPTLRLPASYMVDPAGGRVVEVPMSGSQTASSTTTDDSAPVLRLRFALRNSGDDASISDSLDAVVLIPSVALGLYENAAADIGLPWAFPLQPFQRSSADDSAHISTRLRHLVATIGQSAAAPMRGKATTRTSRFPKQPRR